MKIKRGFGVLLILTGVIGLAVMIAILISSWVANNILQSWSIFAFGLILGAAFIIWGYLDLRRTHQIHSSKENHKINDTPKNNSTC